MTLPEITEIRRLNVKPGEALLVTLKHPDGERDADYVGRMFKDALPGVTVLLMAEGFLDLEVVAKDAVPK